MFPVLELSLLTDPWKRAYLGWLMRLPFTKRFQDMKLTLPDGQLIYIADFASFVSTYKSVFVDRSYEFRSPTRSPYIVICGENIGLSVLFFKKLYPEAVITAFEADPVIFAILKRNVRTWKLKHVYLQNVAVWTKKTTLRFHSDHADGGRIDSAASVSMSVPTLRLREWLESQPEITFLNMDIEGAEAGVVLDAWTKLRQIPFLFIEYHSLADKAQAIGKILDHIIQAGYRIHLKSELSSVSPFWHLKVRGGMDMQVNIFAWKKKNEPKLN